MTFENLGKDITFWGPVKITNNSGTTEYYNEMIGVPFAKYVSSVGAYVPGYTYDSVEIKAYFPFLCKIMIGNNDAGTSFNLNRDISIRVTFNQDGTRKVSVY